MTDRPITRLASDCPFCGKPLVRRQRKDRTGEFLSCSGWPACKHAESVNLHLDRLARQLRGAEADRDLYKEERDTFEQLLSKLRREYELLVAEGRP